LKNSLKTREQLKEEFLFSLDKEFEKVNNFFMSKKANLETRLTYLKQKSEVLITGPKRNHEATLLILSGLEDYKSEFYRLLKFLEVNKTGFTKIFKKFNKKIGGGRAGERYLDDKMNSTSFANNSPLLILIDTIEEMENQLTDTSRNSAHQAVDTGHVSPKMLAVLELDDPDELGRCIREFTLADADHQTLLNTIFRKSGSLKATRCFRKVIELGASINEVDDVNERSSVHYFAIKGNCEFLAIMIEFGAKLDACDLFGRTALHYASIYGHTLCVELLINRGHVITNLRDHEGYTPLFYSVVNGHVDIVKLLLAHSKKNINDVANELKPYLATTFEDSDRQETLLALACSYGHKPIAELLIHAGSDVNYIDENNETPLHHCCRHGYEDCVRLLLSKGSRHDLPGALTGWTPIFYCASNGFDDCIRLLIDHGAQVEVRDMNLWTPFDHAVFRGHRHTAALLKSYKRSSCDQVLLPNGLGPFEMNGGGPELELNAERRPDLSPTLERIYGHEYLKETSMVRIRLTSTDKRRPFEFVRLADMSMLRSHLSLILYDTSSPTTSQHVINLPMREHQDTLVFRCQNLEKFSLNIDLVPTFKRSMILARALVLPAIFIHLSGIATVPLLSSSLKPAGELNFEFRVVQPFSHLRLGPLGKHMYWKAIKVRLRLV
jgi:ankyrin repeat protein